MRPEQVKVALTLADGSLAVMGFVTRGFNPDGSVQFEREPTPENIQAEIAKAGLAVVSWRFVDDADLPASREYRNAWHDTGTAIDHDMPKAREIHRERLRAARKPLLEALDIEYQRADEDGDAAHKRDVVEHKNWLRGITDDPRIDAAQTIDDLKTVAVGMP
jgi:hypothetical protein